MKLTTSLAILSALLASQVNAAVFTSTSSAKSSTKTSSTSTPTPTPTPSSSTSTFSGVGQWEQCGGIGYVGATVCAPGLTCIPIGPGNSYFLTCSATSTSASSTTSSASMLTSTSSSASSSTSTFLGVPLNNQCGGPNWTGPTVCAEGLACDPIDGYYQYCRPFVPEYAQCGGQGYTGPTVCAPGLTCVVNNVYFHNCYYVTSTSSTSTPTSTSVVPVVPEYGQCGGLTWKGNTVCASGLTCVRLNDYFYQCLNQATSTV